MQRQALQFAARREVPRVITIVGGTLACILTLSPTALADDEDAAVGPAAAPAGAVRALAAQARRSGRELIVPLTTVGPSERLRQFRVVAGNGRVEGLESEPTVTLPPQGTTLLSSTDASKIAVASELRVGEKTALPLALIDAKPSEQESEASVLRTARPYLTLSNAVRWNEKGEYHVAEFRLWLESKDSVRLEQPVIATFSTSCIEVVAATVRLERMGLAGGQTFAVRCDRNAAKAPQQQSIDVRLGDADSSLQLEAAQLTFKFEIPHQPGAPVLTSSATRVPGFGVSSVFLSVRNVEVDGAPQQVARATTFQLAAEGVPIEPSLITIPAGQSEMRVEVRSPSMGKVRIHAAGEYASESVAIEFGFPYALLFTSLLGGSAGGYLSTLRLKSKQPRKRIKLVQAIAEGAIVGVLVVVALLVLPGVAALPNWARSSAIGWLLASALAGFTGSELIERIAARVFGKRPEAEDRPSTTAA